MEITERHIEAGEQAVSLQRDRRIASIRAELDGQGEDDCIDCGDPIDVARRMALPSARRCLECQRASERKNRA